MNDDFSVQQSTLDRKKKNFTFSRKFPFMKSKDDKSEDGSDQERKFISNFFFYLFPSSSISNFGYSIVLYSFFVILFLFLLLPLESSVTPNDNEQNPSCKYFIY